MLKNPTDKRFRFIPFRQRDLVDMCLQDKRLLGREEQFKTFYKLLISIFHFEFHQQIESLKDSYAQIDPNSDTRLVEMLSGDSNADFVELLRELLEKANYEAITEAELNQAMKESSLFKIRLQVDFDVFSEVLLFCRGESRRQETIKGWLGLFSKTVEFVNYERVVVYLRFNEDQTIHSIPHCHPGSTLLKLFQNVPKADLEMLFPNTQVRMRLLDKVLIGVPALVSGAIVLTTKLGASLVLMGALVGYWFGLSEQPVELNKTTLLVLLAGVGALGGYLWKQFNSFKNRKMRFMQTLTENLYFKNLDNNAGVFHRIANDAEEEECKEAILAYYFLLVSETPLSRDKLDQQIECWFDQRWHCQIDFEIDDALHKLLSLGLIKQQDKGYSVIELNSAIAKLNQRWDDYFVLES